MERHLSDNFLCKRLFDENDSIRVALLDPEPGRTERAAPVANFASRVLAIKTLRERKPSPTATFRGVLWRKLVF
jgi:hypothetical protein